MIGGGRQESLSSALLLDWAQQHILEDMMRKWLTDNGALIIENMTNVHQVMEEFNTCLNTGTIFEKLQKAEIAESYVFDEIGGTTTKKVVVTNTPTWVFFTFRGGYSYSEPATILGPRGGILGRINLGHRFERRIEALKDSWQISLTSPKGEVLVNKEYGWLYGKDHTVCWTSEFKILEKAIRITTNSKKADVICSCIAKAFNEIVAKVIPIAPEKIQSVLIQPNTINPPKLFPNEIARLDRIRESGLGCRKAEIRSRIRAAEKVIADQTRLDTLVTKVINLSLDASLKTIIDLGLASQIKQDHRGLWFLFDQLYGSVTPEVAEKNGVVAGIYHIEPVVVLLEWNGKGGDWVCGNVAGGMHPHPHASNTGAWRRPCFGDKGFGFEGIGNRDWFSILWEINPVEWAKAIQVFLTNTTLEHNYRGIWEFGTLVKAQEVDQVMLKVKKIETDDRILNVVRLREAEMEA